MIRRLAIALVLSCTLPALAQTPSSTARLTINLTPDPNQGDVPQTFTITLTNATDHDIRLAQPEKGCFSNYEGAVVVMMSFAPSRQDTSSLPRSSVSCIADYGRANGSGPPNILEQAKHWKILHAGEHAAFDSIKSPGAHSDNLHAGTYTFSAVYDPPAMSHEDADLLHANNIDFQQIRLESAKFIFQKIAP
jgi:hypothetical protein